MNQATPAQSSSQPEPPKVFAVSLVTGEIWQLGRPVPGTDQTRSVGSDGQEIVQSEGSQTLIVRQMFVNGDGSVDVYALPVPGSAFDKQQTGAIFTLYPLTIQRVLTVARFDVWKDMLEDAQLAELDDGEDPEDPEGPEVPEVGPAAGSVQVQSQEVPSLANGNPS
jgi:hypothetical protein